MREWKFAAQTRLLRPLDLEDTPKVGCETVQLQDEGDQAGSCDPESTEDLLC